MYERILRLLIDIICFVALVCDGAEALARLRLLFWHSNSRATAVNQLLYFPPACEIIAHILDETG